MKENLKKWFQLKTRMMRITTIRERSVSYLLILQNGCMNLHKENHMNLSDIAMRNNHVHAGKYLFTAIACWFSKTTWSINKTFYVCQSSKNCSLQIPRLTHKHFAECACLINFILNMNFWLTGNFCIFKIRSFAGLIWHSTDEKIGNSQENCGRHISENWTERNVNVKKHH